MGLNAAGEAENKTAAHVLAPPQPPWGCEIFGSGDAWSCDRLTPLAPGETSSIAFNLKLSLGPTAKRIQNCAQTNVIGTDPVNKKKFTKNLISCAEAPLGGPNLAIKKEPPNAAVQGGEGHCDLNGACNFLITIKNAGDADYKGPLTITDVVGREFPGVEIAESIAVGNTVPNKANFTCVPVPTAGKVNCAAPELSIAPGANVQLTIAVIAGKTWKKDDTLRNCVTLKREGNDTGPEVDNVACADAKLDPFNVKVAKTGDQSCAPGGDCHFKLKLFNPGPIDHNAPVTISDKLTGLASAQIVSITPALPCAAQPTQIPFSCTSPGPVRLDLDAKAGSEFGPREFEMVIRLPADAPSQFSNCATVADPDGARSDGTASTACATVETKPPVTGGGTNGTSPSSSSLTITKTAASASCNETTPCNFNITVTNTSGQAVAGPIAVLDTVTFGGAPLQEKLAAEPPAPWSCIFWAAPGNMRCTHPGPLAAGASLDLPVALQPLPGSLGASNEVRSEVKNCATLAGVRAAPATACATIPVKTTVTPPLKCFAGMVLNASGACVCEPPATWNGRACTGGGTNGVYPQPGLPTCSGGMILTYRGLCACPRSQRWNGRTCAEANTLPPERIPERGGGTNGTPALPCRSSGRNAAELLSRRHALRERRLPPSQQRPRH